MSGRTLVIGDIHGCNRAFDVLVSNIRLMSDDIVVVLGDVVDRGPGSKQTIDRLLEIERFCEMVLIKGNHEEMMLNAMSSGEWFADWLQFGGSDTLKSYGGEPQNVPEEHLDFLAAGLDYWETDSEIFIHANLEPEIPLAEQSPDWLRWTQITGVEKPHPSGKTVICGHSAQRSGVPTVWPGWICIDTCVYGGGALTCLNVESGELYQSQQNGAYRDGLGISDFGTA